MKKKIIQLSIICIIGLLLASCSTSYITKRRYMKGFYVEHKNKSQSDIAIAKHVKPSTLETKKSSLPVASNEPEIHPANTETGGYVIAVPEKEKSAHNSVASAKKPEQKSNFKKALNKAGELYLSPFSFKANAEKIVSPEGGLIAATLSLFWIVLVILLVFYLIGIVFEGFGLGPIFNLFGLVLLILLILWLLGVV